MTPWDTFAKQDLMKAMEQWVINGRVGAGTWGYVLLRGVYTPGSNANFSLAIDKLRRWVRFLVYDSMNSVPTGMRIRQSGHFVKTDPQFNEQLWKRFSLDVLEDESALRIDDPEWYLDKQGLLLKYCNYFTDWVASQGYEVEDERLDSRFNDFLVVDAASMATLLEMPEPPQPRPCNNMQEWNSLRNTGSPPAFVWMLDAHLIKNKPRFLEEDPDFYNSARSWYAVMTSAAFDKCVMKLEVTSMRDAYFERRAQGKKPIGLPCRETPEGSGVWLYENLLRHY